MSCTVCLTVDKEHEVIPSESEVQKVMQRFQWDYLTAYRHVQGRMAALESLNRQRQRAVEAACAAWGKAA